MGGGIGVNGEGGGVWGCEHGYSSQTIMWH